MHKTMQIWQMTSLKQFDAMLQHSFIWTLTDPEEDLIQNIKFRFPKCNEI